MAGAGVATAHSFDCVYLNPAGLGAIRTKYLAGGLSYGVLDLELNGRASTAQNTIGTTFGVVVPLNLRGALRDRLTLGLGILVPQNAVAALYITDDVCPVCGTETIGNDRVCVSVNPVFLEFSNLSFAAWAHVECFERCPILEEPTPLAW